MAEHGGEDSECVREFVGLAKVLLVIVSQSIQIRPLTWDAISELNRGAHIVDILIVTEQNPPGDPNSIIMRNLEKARHYAIQLAYDYMFIVENDVVVPQHTLMSLMNPGDVVGDVTVGLYPERPSKVATDEFLVCMSWNDNKNAREQIERGAPFYLTGRGGFGCVLVSRHVFSKVKFPVGDMSWYDILHAEGFKVLCNPGVICFHIDHTAEG
ncbi:unnamed protein product [marine sediment metagenome]|uniref:Glycosyltransferase 2-like domain-containing protein n=1 Tax=marine sediment metagenome TaxID=412755 RepID=X1PMR2_9ZZZZ